MARREFMVVQFAVTISARACSHKCERARSRFGIPFVADFSTFASCSNAIVCANRNLQKLGLEIEFYL